MKSLFTLLVSVSLLLFMVSAPSCKKDDDKPKTEICGNGIDDDGNGFTDLQDLQCTETGTECSNGIDDDGDGFIDCLDFDCDGVSGC